MRTRLFSDQTNKIKEESGTCGCVDPDPQDWFKELKYALVTRVRLMMFTGIN